MQDTREERREEKREEDHLRQGRQERREEDLQRQGRQDHQRQGRQEESEGQVAVDKTQNTRMTDIPITFGDVRMGQMDV